MMELPANCPTPHDCTCAGTTGLRSSLDNLAKAIVEVNSVSDTLQTATHSALTDHVGRLQQAADPAAHDRRADVRPAAEEESFTEATELAGVGAAAEDQRGNKVYEADTFDDVDDYDEWRERRKKQQREDVEQTLRMLAELKSVLQAREQ